MPVTVSSEAVIAHSLLIRLQKCFRGFRKPLTHARTLIPQATGTQVSQEVTNVERGISEAEAIKIDDEHLVAVKEQLAGLKAAMGRSVAIRLQCLQSCGKFLCEMTVPQRPV